jgi:predicted molibdopterin-dependent oxidoreductase YjgC
MSSQDIMNKITKSNQSVISGVDDQDVKFWADINIMGEEYRVPADLTIMQAMEYAGFRLIHSCGCRAGFCGACATVYRVKGDYRLKAAMACQTKVEHGMYLVQIPFSPAEKALYDVNCEKYDSHVFLKYYPVIARCVSCNTCSKACPQDIRVMDYVQAALKGDFKRVADLSFDCIQCGLCAVRCPAEIVQYHVAQLGRRLYGIYGNTKEKNVEKMVKDIREKKFDAEFEALFALSPEDLKETYRKQQQRKEK